MTLLSDLRNVRKNYRKALNNLWPLLAVHLIVRLVAASLLLPVSGLLLAIVMSTVGQSVIIDQEIAVFLLSPVGMVAGLLLVSMLITCSVMDVVNMTAVLSCGERTASGALSICLAVFRTRFIPVFLFNLKLLALILLWSAPFVVLAAAIALFVLGDHDINYYLTFWPTTFTVGVVLVTLLGAMLAIVLIWRLSGWSAALNLLIQEDVKPGRTFGESQRRLRGSQLRIVGRIGTWLLIRLGLGLIIVIVSGFLIELISNSIISLQAAALVSGLVFLLWALANSILAAVSNGALSGLLNDVYTQMAGGSSSRGWMQRPRQEPSRTLQGATAALVVAMIIVGLVLGNNLLTSLGADRNPEIIAHRGASAAKPENTMSAVRQALEDRADWVEIDVQETADGQVVIAHDSDFMKVAGVPLKVWDATMEDLSMIDIGSWFGAAYAGERTATLRDTLRAVQGRGKLLIELKYYGHDVELEAKVRDLIHETGMTESVAIMSLKYRGVQKMRQLAPELRYGVLAAKAIGDLASLEADFLAVNTGQITTALIRSAHARNKQVYAWTVDDPMTMSRMISMGVDGLITNKPSLARQVANARNELSTAERLVLWLADRMRVESFILTEDEEDA